MIAAAKKAFEQLQKMEPYYFYGLVFLNLLPVLTTAFFPTVDGPSHLYNAKSIAELWTDPSGTIGQYLKFNDTVTPNWTGHFLLSVLLMVCSAGCAEKSILLIYLIGFPVGVRYLFNAARVRNKWLIYLIFPFTYSYLFHYGFYNFNIGLVLFFFAVGLWSKYVRSRSLIHLSGLALTSSLMVLSHPFVFLLFVCVVFILSLTIIGLSFNAGAKKGDGSLKRFAYPFLTLIPGLSLTGWFVLTDGSIQVSATSLHMSDIFTSLKYIMPIKGIEVQAYDLMSRVMLYLFSVLTIVAFVRVFSTWRKTGAIGFRNAVWVPVTITLFILLFIVPDYLGAAGLITARLMWFFFIFLIICLASVKLPKWLVMVTFLVTSGVTIWTILHNYKAICKPAAVANELTLAAKIIEPYSTVLPVTIRRSKPYVHITNYLGVEKPIILLHNYEAALTYFPLKWRYGSIAPQKMGGMNPTECVPWIGGKRETEAVQINYVCVVIEPGVTDHLDCEEVLNTDLAEYYELVFVNLDKTIMLYRSLAMNLE